jgi:hypothetical protein
MFNFGPQACAGRRNRQGTRNSNGKRDGPVSASHAAGMDKCCRPFQNYAAIGERSMSGLP